ncbi:hypothetical protein [Burkholderia sp. B21-007]|uniref:hypothetical protein n=1 Tax=Burkholderia sp. B21-007 TaxID=2890407 RepID=UPI001E4E15B6|nr:hypothetical protein [Burkholderia sp. B21-007]UEP30795.1 hypothetical protein LMA01_30935 [Burkholderia sp. B21-007]
MFLLRVAGTSRRVTRWFGRVADPLSKWTAIVAVFVGGGWAIYKYAVAGAQDWAINLSVSGQVVQYHDKLGLLVVHIHAKNPLDNEVNLDSKSDAYKLTIHQIPDGKPLGAVSDPDDPPAKGMFAKTIKMMPTDGYTFLPKVDFDDATSVVVPLGSTLWVTAGLTFEGDYVSASEVITVPDKMASGDAHRDRPAINPA